MACRRPTLYTARPAAQPVPAWLAGASHLQKALARQRVPASSGLQRNHMHWQRPITSEDTYHGCGRLVPCGSASCAWGAGTDVGRGSAVSVGGREMPGCGEKDGEEGRGGLEQGTHEGGSPCSTTPGPHRQGTAKYSRAQWTLLLACRQAPRKELLPAGSRGLTKACMHAVNEVLPGGCRIGGVRGRQPTAGHHPVCLLSSQDPPEGPALSCRPHFKARAWAATPGQVHGWSRTCGARPKLQRHEAASEAPAPHGARMLHYLRPHVAIGTPRHCRCNRRGRSWAAGTPRWNWVALAAGVLSARPRTAVSVRRRLVSGAWCLPGATPRCGLVRSLSPV